ncbi:3367_t:CDS:2, partial [Funneliformis geosporum]
LGGGKNCAAIRANFPIPEQCGLFYFEIEIINKGENGRIGIGFCTKSASLNKMPGIAFRDLKNTLHPCVGILSPGGSIRANFGYKKFKYT